jgi:rSAM/selenodomain-associated transferase 2
VIVPTLNEEKCIAATLGHAAAAGVEIVVVDGGSEDATIAVARRYADQILETTRGRAPQMNAGAKAASAEVLLFLHADTHLPDGYDAAVRAALADPAVVGGRFDVQLDAPGAAYAWLGRFISLRSRMSRVATGDQAIFVRRAVFERLGGYTTLAIMEDLAFSRALKRAGAIACLRATVVTSARRWQRYGLWRTILLMWSLRLMYYAGVPAAYLRTLYPAHGGSEGSAGRGQRRHGHGAREDLR